MYKKKFEPESSNSLYRHVNESKEHFENIYNQPDPRAYFSTLSQFDYVIPEMACPVLRAILQRLRIMRGLDKLQVVDLGCSYGINAALLKRGVSLQELYDHYRQMSDVGTGAKSIVEHDACFFARYPPSSDLKVIGLDVAERAVAYAKEVGLVDEAVVADLEAAAPPSEATSLLADADAVVSTGCVGYVGSTTFDRIISAVRTKSEPWVASFVLRMFPYDDIAETLARHGLVTEKLDGVLFPQRRFASADEKYKVVATLREMDIDAAGLEDEHGFLAEFYLSRPQSEVAALPLRDLLPFGVIPDDTILHMANRP